MANLFLSKFLEVCCADQNCYENHIYFFIVPYIQHVQNPNTKERNYYPKKTL